MSSKMQTLPLNQRSCTWNGIWTTYIHISWVGHIRRINQLCYSRMLQVFPCCQDIYSSKNRNSISICTELILFRHYKLCGQHMDSNHHHLIHFSSRPITSLSWLSTSSCSKQRCQDLVMRAGLEPAFHVWITIFCFKSSSLSIAFGS